MVAKESSERDLVFAIAHEIGNHLGAIRLQAHLLDEDLDPRSLAQASVEIDGLAGRSGPLLALLRPLLTQETLSERSASWAGLIAAIKQQVEDEGTRGVSVEIEAPGDRRDRAPAVDWLHSLMIVLLDATLERTPREGSIRIGLDSRDGEAAFYLEDDGADEDLSASASLRGRPLAVALARALLPSVGGRVETDRGESRTRIELVFPTAN